jgi:hypothetical protein
MVKNRVTAHPTLTLGEAKVLLWAAMAYEDRHGGTNSGLSNTERADLTEGLRRLRRAIGHAAHYASQHPAEDPTRFPTGYCQGGCTIPAPIGGWPV